MEQKPVFISVCNQKGGIGKSTFTVLLADILHYMEGYRVLVVDCDYPQKSIFDQRKRELALLDRSPHYKSLLVRQFGMTHREIWPVIASSPEKALADMDRQLGMLREPVDFVLFDLPGTVGTPGVLRTLSAIDRIFVPMKADRYVMESTLAFAKSVEDHLVRKPNVPTAGIHLFWTMIDRRERTPLYDLYDKALEKLGLHRMEAHIPYRSRFNDEDMLREAVGGQSSEGSMLEVAERQSAGSEEQSELPSGRKRRMTLPDYEATFLKPVRIKVRSALYVSEETRCKISEVARKIGTGRVSVIGYVENILRNHLEIYKAEINRLHREINKDDLL